MKTHFTGIKGTGMAALAEIVYDEGQTVTGSDIEKYIFTEDGLRKRNIPILKFEEAEFEPGDTVVVGLSFDKDFPEVKKALNTEGVKVYWYNEYLGKLMENYTSICVAGCHGKSTTTGLVASVLSQDISTAYLIGDGHGSMPADSDFFVLESCEFKRHFLAYHPDYALITNIELDHVDYYKDLDDYISAFQTFVLQAKKGCVIWGDDPYLPHLRYEVPVTTFGLNEDNDYRAINVKFDADGLEYDVMHEGRQLGHVALPQTGMPMVWDSLAAFAMGSMLGMKPEEIIAGLESYHGIARRFVETKAGDSVLIDDYAHHPTAIHNMIEAAREKYPDKKVVALYKPDRYSRLQYFLDRFASSLNEADQSFVLDFPVNAVREDETITVTIDDLLKKLENGALLDISKQSAETLARLNPAVYLFMSSKDIYLLRDMTAEILNEEAEELQ